MKKFESTIVVTLLFLFSTIVVVSGCQKNEKAGIQNLFMDASPAKALT